MFLISEAHAQGTAPAAAAGGFDGSFLILMIGAMAVLFFVQIRSQRKRQKETDEMLKAVAKGDEVVTSGGIVGKVSKVGDNYLHIETGGSGVELQVQRTAIVQVLPKGSLK